MAASTYAASKRRLATSQPSCNSAPVRPFCTPSYHQRPSAMVVSTPLHGGHASAFIIKATPTKDHRSVLTSSSYCELFVASSVLVPLMSKDDIAKHGASSKTRRGVAACNGRYPTVTSWSQYVASPSGRPRVSVSRSLFRQRRQMVIHDALLESRENTDTRGDTRNIPHQHETGRATCRQESSLDSDLQPRRTLA